MNFSFFLKILLPAHRPYAFRVRCAAVWVAKPCILVGLARAAVGAKACAAAVRFFGAKGTIIAHSIFAVGGADAAANGVITRAAFRVAKKTVEVFV